MMNYDDPSATARGSVQPFAGWRARHVIIINQFSSSSSSSGFFGLLFSCSTQVSFPPCSSKPEAAISYHARSPTGNRPLLLLPPLATLAHAVPHVHTYTRQADLFFIDGAER